jgi:hypothetical protein
MRVESWAKEMKEELEKRGLQYILQNQQEGNTSSLGIVTEVLCNDTETRNLFTKACEKISLVFFYQYMKRIRNTEEYAEGCSRNERNWIP